MRWRLMALPTIVVAYAAAGRVALAAVLYGVFELVTWQLVF